MARGRVAPGAAAIMQACAAGDNRGRGTSLRAGSRGRGGRHGVMYLPFGGIYLVGGVRRPCCPYLDGDFRRSAPRQGPLRQFHGEHHRGRGQSCAALVRLASPSGARLGLRHCTARNAAPANPAPRDRRIRSQDERPPHHQNSNLEDGDGPRRGSAQTRHLTLNTAPPATSAHRACSVLHHRELGKGAWHRSASSTSATPVSTSCICSNSQPKDRRGCGMSLKVLAVDDSRTMRHAAPRRPDRGRDGRAQMTGVHGLEVLDGLAPTQ